MAEVRRDIVTDTWVIVQTEEESPILGPATPKAVEPCPFDEGREDLTPPEVFAIRQKGTGQNRPGWQVRVVPSDQPILRIEGDLKRAGVGVHDMVSGIGANEVIIETPRHETEFCSLPAEQIALVMIACRQRIADLYRDQRFRYVMVFKNYGKGAGASGVVHSHSELIALPATPRRIKDELNGARDYFEYKERCIFCDIIEEEQAVEKRILLETEHFLVFAPYASRFPFELTVIPKRHECTFEAATDAELSDMGSVMKRTLKAVHDALLDPPYNFVLHTAPNLLPKSGYWKTIKDDYHWHVEIIPRVKRVAGFEWGSGFHINPVAPERAIKALRTRMQG